MGNQRSSLLMEKRFFGRIMKITRRRKCCVQHTDTRIGFSGRNAEVISDIYHSGSLGGKLFNHRNPPMRKSAHAFCSLIVGKPHPAGTCSLFLIILQFLSNPAPFLFSSAFTFLSARRGRSGKRKRVKRATFQQLHPFRPRARGIYRLLRAPPSVSCSRRS